MKIIWPDWQALLMAAVASLWSASGIASPADVPERQDSGVNQPTEALVARKGDTAAIRMHIGDTGIKCLRLPCPSRGVFLPRDPSHKARDALLYADVDGTSPPPPMVGDTADLAAITTAWNDRQCLAIDGRLISGVDDRPILRIDKVVGPCRDARK